MKHHPHHKSHFEANRKNLAKKLKPNSVVIVQSNDIFPSNGDGTMKFKENSNLFYLTGIAQEGTFFIMAPDFPDAKMREILLIKETNEHIVIWEGNKLSPQEATLKSGIGTVQWNQSLDGLLKQLLAESDNVYVETNEHIRNDSVVETSRDHFITSFKKRYPVHQYQRLAPLMTDLRCIKSPHEIEVLKTACDITEKGFRKALKEIEPKKHEYEIEATYIYEFLKNGADGFAYEPIIGSGINSCVLHYLQNNQMMLEGDVVLMDVGAEYGGYNADMTRTAPVNGRFSDRQRAVYQSVLNVKNKATKLLRPGITIPQYHEQVGKIMEEELLKLKLIDKTDIKNQSPKFPAYKKYFMHGTSHHLGLDVHDVASVYTPISEGMVLTVEPGIYIPNENIGIRLEDNIVVEKNNNKNLMESIPIEVEEIEEIMNI